MIRKGKSVSSLAARRPKLANDNDMNEEEDGDDACSYAHLNSSYNRKDKKAGGWQALGLDYPVFKGVQRHGYRVPTPIQRKAIPPILEGKDVVAMSRTGSGKTAAFVVPMLQKLKRRATQGARALLISPTRELALQTFNFIKQLGRYTGLRGAVLVGGDNINEQFSTLHENPDIIVATPGRLLHIVMEMNAKLTAVEYVVFDEADRLFEMGFADQLAEVMARLPDSRQTLLFSATLPKTLVDFARAGLSHPVLVRLDTDSKISDKLEMGFALCRSIDKLPAVVQLIRKLVNTGRPDERTVVFCATMKHVEHLVGVLNAADIECSYLYSQLDTTARKINMQRFRNKETRVLVVTDVAARGVDIPLLDNAVNYHFPPKAKLFVHRVGRVARAGMCGRAYSVVSPDEMPHLVDLFLFLNRPLLFVSAKTDGDVADSMIGSVCQAAIDSEIEFLKNIHEDVDMLDLRKKCENAMYKYNKSRPAPSAESVRRVKKQLRPLIDAAGVHPWFAYALPASAAEREKEEARNKLVDALRNFKPATLQTIFEVNSGSKQAPAAIMKAKRREHQKYLKKRKLDRGGAAQENDEEGVPETPASPQKSRKIDCAIEKAEFFVPYMPADFHTEKGLSVEKGFDHDAERAVLDFMADDATDLHKQQQHRKLWDRKLKKFVGPGEGEAKKKIRTEEGLLIPASYKSGRYEQWKKKRRIGDDDNDEQDGDYNDNVATTTSGGRRFGGSAAGPRRGGKKSELKSKEQILKERRRKEKINAYQSYRKTQNAGKKRSSAGR